MNAIDQNHHADRDWDCVMAQLRHEMASRAGHPAHAVVLLPYVQLIGIARQAWLQSLRGRLQRAGQWTVRLQDTTGQAVIDALHLQSQSQVDLPDSGQRIGAGAYCNWVGQVPEAGGFGSPHPAQARVGVLPSSQLLGRTVAAVVFPGCDENHRSASRFFALRQRGLRESDQLDCEVQLGRWTLVGRVDRIDRVQDGSRHVIDYKTEARARPSASSVHRRIANGCFMRHCCGTMRDWLPGRAAVQRIHAAQSVRAAFLGRQGAWIELPSDAQ